MDTFTRINDPDLADNMLESYLGGVQSLLNDEPGWQELAGCRELWEGRPVGLLPPNAAKCHDQFGHIREWCGDSVTGGQRDGLLAWVKGGPFSNDKTSLWASCGGQFDPSIRFHQIGFRIGGETRGAPAPDSI
jgi:formylglycine-generating enzyme required for sulfatase activity